MVRWTRVYAVACSIFVVLSTQACQCAANTTTLRLLVMLNLGTRQEDRVWTPRWDRGLELLPAAQLAVDRINQDPTILHGYHLDLTEMDTGGCDHGYPSDALFEFVNKMTRKEQHIVGVVGAFCTTLAKAVVLFAERSGTKVLEVLELPSPALHDRVRYPHLFHMIPSSAVNTEAVCSLIGQFDWPRVGVVSDNSMEHSHYAMRNMLRGKVAFYPFRGAQSLLRTLQGRWERIVVLSVGIEQAAEVLCLSYKEALHWPQLHYTWIVYEHEVEDFFHATSTCDNDTMKNALEGVFLIRYQLSVSNSDRVIVSGQTYREYYDDYLKRLSHFAVQRNTSLNPNPYSNALHDSVWATAIALNVSLQTIGGNIGSSEMLETANSELANVSFAGALGNVDFDNNGESEVAVNIFRIRNGTAELYAVISDKQCNETATGGNPDDEIPHIYSLQSSAIVAVMLTIEAALIVLTTVILILFLYYRNAPEIMATSPYLSLTMFVGCYSLFASAAMRVISPSVIHDGVFLCSAPEWCLSLGIHLVFTPLIMRMLRVYRIFTYFGKMGKRWSDGVLFAAILVILGIDVIFLTVLQVFNVSNGINIETLAIPEGSFPYYEVIQACTPPMLIAIILLECEAVLYNTVVVFLALLTRKIRRQHFKDTKKVNIFIYLNTLLSYILFPLPRIITNRDIQVYLTFAAINSTAFLCQMLLFLPKCLPPLLRHLKSKHWKTARSKSMTSEGGTILTNVYASLNYRFSI